MTVNLDFPLHFDPRGRTAEATGDKHVRDLIEQVLFTSPGERVNRPDFGSGLLQLVFAPNSDELAATVRFLAESALHQWLADLIEVDSVDVETRDATLRVSVQYVVRDTGEKRVAQFDRGAQ